jgi:hypothetical protein
MLFLNKKPKGIVAASNLSQPASQSLVGIAIVMEIFSLQETG